VWPARRAAASSLWLGVVCVPSFLSWSVLGDVVEAQFDRCVTTEDVDEHDDLLLVDVDVLDDTVEIGERPGHDPHLLTHLPGGLEAGLDLLLLFLHPEEALDLPPGEGRGLLVPSHESGDSGRIADRIPGVVVETHPDQDVAREHLARHGDLL